jgi:hypothetical protein
LFTQCVDGQWTNGGPQCREGIWDFLVFFCLIHFSI